MLKLIFREIIILTVCVSIFPGAILLLYLRGEIGQAQLLVIARELVATEMVGPWPMISLVGKIFIPYFVVQAMRAYYWSKRSIKGLRYANLYYSIMLLIAVGWLWGKSWDLLYFMYLMEDLPAELPQFIELEALNLLVGALSLYTSYRCFKVYLYALEPLDRKSAIGR